MLKLTSFYDERGRLTPVDGVLPFEIKRMYYISNVNNESERGGHSHILTVEALFCVSGSFSVVINNGKTKEEFYLNDHNHCLIIEPNDWHMMHNFSMGAILLGVSSTSFDKSDYIYEEPEIV